MTNLKPDFDANELELHDLLGDRDAGCPSLALLMACGQGVLSPEVEAFVQRHILNCCLCAQLISDLSTLPQEELSAAQHSRIAAQLGIRKQGVSYGWRLYGGAIAAAAIVAVVLTALHVRQTPQSASAPATAVAPQTKPNTPVTIAAMEPSFTALPAPGVDAISPLTRGGAASNEPTVSLLLPAFTAYNKGDYAVAAQRFQHLQKRYPQNRLIALYLGVSQLFLHQDEQARANLTLAMQQSTDANRDPAAWYAAIAAQRTGATEAHTLYAGLCAEKNSPYSAASCRLASQLP